MNQIAPLSDFTDQADEIVLDESDDASEANADRNFQMLGNIFSDFERVFSAVNR